MKKNLPKILAIIINYRLPLDTINLVRSIRKQSIKADVLVIDNHSGDNSTDLFKSNRINFISSKVNSGFGYGCNIGFKYGLKHNYDFFWLLNNDSILKDVHTLKNMYMPYCYDRLKKIGLVGAMLIDPTNIYPNHAGFFLDPVSLQIKHLKSSFQINAKKYAWISACSLLIPSKVLKKVGLFDENFFMYWEDVDLSMRVKAKGFSIEVSNEAIIYHSPGKSSSNNILNRYSWHISSAYYWAHKHFKFKQYAILFLLVKNILNAIRLRSFILFKHSFKTIKIKYLI
jgi:GT2 family glycosyltransferase